MNRGLLTLYRRQWSKPFPRKRKVKCLSEEVLQIEKRREGKGNGEKERYIHLNAEFQRIARRDKKICLSSLNHGLERSSGIPDSPGSFTHKVSRGRVLTLQSWLLNWVLCTPILCWMNTASWIQTWSSKQWTRWVKRIGKKASITGQTRKGDAWTKVPAAGRDRKWLLVFPMSFETHSALCSVTQGWLLGMTSTVLWLFAWCWSMEDDQRRWITVLER